MHEKREEQFNFVKKVVALMLLGLWFGFFAYLLIDSTRERLWGGFHRFTFCWNLS